MLTTYEYDQRGRVVRSFTASEWTAEDRALMLARDLYRKTLCPNCGHLKDKAWHPDNDGWFEVVEEFTCHACTALQNHGSEGSGRPAVFLGVADTRDYGTNPLPPLPTSARLSDEELAEAMGGAR